MILSEKSATFRDHALIDRSHTACSVTNSVIGPENNTSSRMGAGQYWGIRRAGCWIDHWRPAVTVVAAGKGGHVVAQVLGVRDRGKGWQVSRVETGDSRGGSMRPVMIVRGQKNRVAARRA